MTKINENYNGFDIETEVLTDHGWKDYKSLDIIFDKLATYNLEKKLNEFVDINNKIIFKYSGDVINGQNKHIDYLITLNQNLFPKTTSKNSKFNFEKVFLGFNNRRIHLVALKKDKTSDNLPEIKLAKLCLAVIADGTVYKKNGTNFPIIRFNLKKERKMNEIEKLMNDCSIPFNKKYCKSREKQGQFGVFEYTINSTFSKPIIEVIGSNKIIPNYFIHYNSEELKELLYTYAFFDGHFDLRNNNTGIIIFSIKKDNIDMLQIMSVLSNLRCVLNKKENLINMFGGVNYIYELYISNNTTSRINEPNTRIDPFNGKMWNLENKNKTLILRRNGKVFISGTN